MISHSGIDLHFPSDAQHISMYIVHLLYLCKNGYAGSLPILKSDYLFFLLLLLNFVSSSYIYINLLPDI